MKKSFICLLALTTVIGLSSCGGNKENSEATETEVVEETVDEVEVPETKAVDETINGLVPGAQYQASFDGFNYDVTLYKDGSFTSSQGGDGSWRMESIHDQPFVVINLHEASGTLYIDQDQNLHQNSASNKGYKLERINYIPDDAKGMEVGKKYKIADFRWDKPAFFTLNQDGTVTSEFDGGNLDYDKWKKTDIDGKEWVVIYYVNNGGDVYRGYLVSPSLENYFFNQYNKQIKLQNGEIVLDGDWKSNRSGRFEE